MKKFTDILKEVSKTYKKIKEVEEKNRRTSKHVFKYHGLKRKARKKKKCRK